MLRSRLPLGVSLFVATILCITASSARAEEVDNPRYARWAKFEVGSTATLEGEAVLGTSKTPLKSVYKLAEKTPDHDVVVEVTTTLTITGGERTPPAQKITIPAKSPQADVKELGMEEVEAAGEKYPCTIYELSNAIPQQKDAKIKAWVNDDVPGGVIKMEITSSGGTMTTTLKSFEKR